MSLFKNKLINIFFTFSDIITAISRISKMFIIRLTESTLYFIVEGEHSSAMWAELEQTHFFDGYVMNGVCPERNEIYLEVDSAMFARSLCTLRMTAKIVHIKLTDKQQPCLTVEIELQSIGSHCRECIHDVPVRVIPRREWNLLQLPNLPAYDVNISTNF